MKLLEYLPPFLQNVKEFIKIFEAEDFEIEYERYLIDSILRETIVKTARSYGITRYEKIYKIKNENSTLEARRLNILLKINNRIPYTEKWLRSILDEMIGKDNYYLKIEDYKLHIKIGLEYTEAAEMLKKNLTKQIPANIELTYELETRLNEYVGATLSNQDYISINAEAYLDLQKININQTNYAGVNINKQDYMEIDPNKEIYVKTENINSNQNYGANVISQEYNELTVFNDYYEENVNVNQNNNTGSNMSSVDYIEI